MTSPEPFPKHARLKHGEHAALIEKIRADYEAGCSIRSIVRTTGRSYGAVHRLLTELGVTFRPRGGGSRR